MYYKLILLEVWPCSHFMELQSDIDLDQKTKMVDVVPETGCGH